MNEAAALPITAGSVVPSAQAVIRPPPTPSRLPSTSRLITGYRTRTLRRSTAEPPGRGGPPKFPPSPYERSKPSTPGSPSGLHSRLFTPFHGLRREQRGSALPLSARRRLSQRRGRLRFTLRTVRSLPQKGFRRWASTRPVSRPSRQPATGPPGSYPDRTHTGRRRRARTNPRSTSWVSILLGALADAYRHALNTGLRPVAASRHLTTAQRGWSTVGPPHGGRAKQSPLPAAVEATTRMTYRHSSDAVTRRHAIASMRR